MEDLETVGDPLFASREGSDDLVPPHQAYSYHSQVYAAFPAYEEGLESVLDSTVSPGSFPNAQIPITSQQIIDPPLQRDLCPWHVYDGSCPGTEYTSQHLRYLAFGLFLLMRSSDVQMQETLEGCSRADISM